MAKANRSHDGAITIIPVKNGFMVRPAYPDDGRSSYPVNDTDTDVFQSLAELHAWLDGHFDYRRETDILADKETGS